MLEIAETVFINYCDFVQAGIGRRIVWTRKQNHGDQKDKEEQDSALGAVQTQEIDDDGDS